MNTSVSCKVSEALRIHDSMNIPKIEFISKMNLGKRSLTLKMSCVQNFFMDEFWLKHA